MVSRRIKLTPVTGKAEVLIDEIARLEIERQAAVQKIEDELGPKVKELQEQITQKMLRVEPYIVAHQSDIFKPGMREGETALSRFGIRTGNPTVVKSKDYIWDALANLFDVSETLGCFVRRKVSVDKEEVLQQWREQTGTYLEVTDRYHIGVAQSDNVWGEVKADMAV